VETQSTSGRIMRGYGQVLDKTLDHQVREVWNGVTGWVGVEAGHLLTGSAYFIVREAMPMLQSMLTMMTLMSLSLSYMRLQLVGVLPQLR
jgi:hypothetical protein